MRSGQLFGLLGGILGLAMPGSTLLVAHPPVGWAATGGRNVPSLLSLSPTRDKGVDGWNQALLLVEPLCPGQMQFQPHLSLVTETLLPNAVGEPRAFDGLYLCALVRSDGQIVKTRIVDGKGNARSLPDIEAMIRAKWRFEARPRSVSGPVWQRVRLDQTIRRPTPIIL